MGEKISEDAILEVCAQLYMKFVPVVQCKQLDWSKPEDRAKFGQTLAKDFANFQKALSDQLRGKLESDK